MEPITTIHGQVSVLDRDDVDTDQIIPKQFLKRVERTASASSSSTTGRRSPAGTCRATRSSSPGANFGCGSSREHAPWGLQDYGFRAIIAPSFADIFYTNCTKIGLLPVVLDEDAVQGGRGGRRGRGRPADQVVRAGGRSVAVRDRPGHPPLPAQRARRHRADAAAAPTRSRPTSRSASAPAPSRPRSSARERRMTKTIALLPGDGIGPEIIAPTRRAARRALGDFAFEEHALRRRRRSTRTAPR